MHGSDGDRMKRTELFAQAPVIVEDLGNVIERFLGKTGAPRSHIGCIQRTAIVLRENHAPVAIDRLKDIQVEGGHLGIRVGIMKELVGIFPLEDSGEHPSCRGPNLVQAEGVGRAMREAVESAFDDTDGKEHQRIDRGVFFGGPKKNL